MTLKPVLTLLAASALAVKLVQHLRRKHQLSRVRDDQLRQRADVTRWEGEGGNLPVKPQC